MIIKKISMNDQDGLQIWDGFVTTHPDATPFHRIAWIRTIAEAYQFEPLLFMMNDDAGETRAVAPFFLKRDLIGRGCLVCLPFSDYCTPLGLEENDSVQILDAIRRLDRGLPRRLEVRGPLPSRTGFVEAKYYRRHILRLCRDPNEVMKAIDKRTIAYNIRRARKSGIEIIEDSTPRGCAEYCRLNALTRKKHGIPPQPREYFGAFAQNLIDGNLGSVLLAIHESRIIAGGVFLKLGNTVYYKYSASEPRALAMLSPNHLLAWTAIERACEEGFLNFDFGRTAPDNEGLIRYKRMWGAEELELPYCFFPRSAGVPKRGEYGGILKNLKAVWRLLPEPLASRIGPSIIRYFG